MKSEKAIRVCVIALICAALVYSCASAQKAVPQVVQGIIFDLDKTPVAGATVELIQGLKLISARTDSRGRFTFVDISLGSYRLQVSKHSYETLAIDIEVNDYQDVIYMQLASYWQLLDAAASSLGMKEWGDADSYLSRAHAIQERSATELFLIASLADKRGDTMAGIAAIKEAIILDDRSPFLWLFLADLSEKAKLGPEVVAEALRKFLDLKYDASAAERLKVLLERIVQK